LVLWLFGIPLIDTLAVMTRRLKHKRSPFDPDRTHIHYVFERNGYTVKHSVLILSLAQLVMVGTGVLFYIFDVRAELVFWSFVFLLAAYFFWLRNYKWTRYPRRSRHAGP
jgi:UDP-GlcNAc:undecaprenyl-phosphate/decaprenyl-phosphate GlcNAc-1-phosphate transferase